MADDSTRKRMPAYVTPLSHDQHAALGRLAVLWGHIEFTIDELLLDTLKLTLKQRSTLIGDMPIGRKVNLLKAAIGDIADTQTRDLVKRFVDLIDETKTRRNHSFHGCWGWRINSRLKTVTVGARHPGDVTNPVRPTQFKNLEHKFMECSRAGFDAFCRFRGIAPFVRPSRFLHGQPPDAPEWLQEWIAHNPVPDANWGYTPPVSKTRRRDRRA